MALWTFYNYVEATGRNPVREWLDSLPPADSAKIDYRLRQMAVLPKWSEKWVSKYRGTDEIYEFRISGDKIQYRPLGTYLGSRRYILLAGAIEKGDKIPRSDVETAERRLANVRKDWAYVRFHEYDSDEDLEEDGN
jgi:phage-related protein